MKMRVMAVTFLMLLVLLGGFAPSVVAAGPETIPVSGSIANPCTGGSLSYDGEFTILDHGKGESLVMFMASGDDSNGNHFRINEVFLAELNTNSAQELTQNINIEIEGVGIHFTESAFAHITITPDGQIAVDIDRSGFTCH